MRPAARGGRQALALANTVLGLMRLQSPPRGRAGALGRHESTFEHVKQSVSSVREGDFDEIYGRDSALVWIVCTLTRLTLRKRASQTQEISQYTLPVLRHAGQQYTKHNTARHKCWPHMLRSLIESHSCRSMGSYSQTCSYAFCLPGPTTNESAYEI